jgi:integrator complex subunit 4
VKLPDTDEILRLVDDGFSKICNMVNDVSVKVRAEAAALLVSESPICMCTFHLKVVNGKFVTDGKR